MFPPQATTTAAAVTFWIVVVLSGNAVPCCWGLQERTVVLLYNKPSNVVTSHAVDDVKGRRNVYQDVYSMQGCCCYCGCHHATTGGGIDPSNASFAKFTGIQSRLHAVGRLDADTTGALLLTNDGGLVHHVTNRDAGTLQHAISKTYHAVIMGHYSNNADIFVQMREYGVNIGKKYGGQTLPVQDLHVLDHPSRKSTTVSLTIAQGKNRQIRRMFHAVGSGVMKLKRVSIGQGLDLASLQEGQWRILSDDEISSCLSYQPRFLNVQETTSPRNSLKRQRQFSRRRRNPTSKRRVR